MKGVKLVDAHFHLWDLDVNSYPWLMGRGQGTLIKDFSSLQKNYLAPTCGTTSAI